MSEGSGTLYVVATPVGNLEDMTPRAVRILSSVDLVAAEDTRHSGRLLHHFGVRAKVVAVHEHNERVEVPRLIDLLRHGKSIALISDAGTPVISDPGFALVRAAREADVSVVPIPGACAAIIALSASGLPSDRFVFEGFPPPKTAPRRARFRELADETRTLIFYESPHRIVATMADLAAVFGADRPGVLARELTKAFETIRSGPLQELYARLCDADAPPRGEFVVLVRGVDAAARVEDAQVGRVVRVLAEALAPAQAAALAARITGRPKAELYNMVLARNRDHD